MINHCTKCNHQWNTEDKGNFFGVTVHIGCEKCEKHCPGCGNCEDDLFDADDEIDEPYCGRCNIRFSDWK